MAAKDHLSPHQFRYEYSKGELEHTIKAYHPSFGGGEIPVGSFSWYHSPGYKFGKSMKPGEISNVEVQGVTKHNSVNYRGHGVATHMYNLAQSYDPKPLHTSESNQTEAGKGWAKKVGGLSVS